MTGGCRTNAELHTIVDLSASECGTGSPCINQTIFGPTTASTYWSSCSDAGLPAAGWALDFFDGSAADPAGKGLPGYVRGVRGGS